MEQTARHDVRHLVAVLIAPATISAWRSYRVVCAAVAIGICWLSSMPDAVRHFQEPADVLAAYGRRQFCMTTPPYPPAVRTEWSRRRAMMSATWSPF